EAKGIRLEATVDPTLGPVAGDASRLQQIVWNLLANAVKFTPRGGTVRMDVTNTASQAVIQVRDTGQGIGPDFLPHVFERFRQADSSTTRSEGGLGLGLAIVRHLVELHGGTVEATSGGEGHGTTFTVRLPLPAVRMGEARSARARIRPADATVTLEGLRILVVDDERDARDAIAAVLEQRGATVTAVGSVREALQHLASARPDVLVSDIAMPIEDGFALIRLLGSLDERTATVPALALTAYSGIGDEERILAAGYRAYLAKPIEAMELVATVARLAGGP